MIGPPVPPDAWLNRFEVRLSICARATFVGSSASLRDLRARARQWPQTREVELAVGQLAPLGNDTFEAPLKVTGEKRANVRGAMHHIQNMVGSDWLPGLLKGVALPEEE